MNMLKTIFCAAALCLGTAAAAAEQYAANFSAPSNGGRSMNFKMEIEVDIKGDGVFDGKVLKVWGASACRYPVGLTGSLVGDDISFKSEVNPTPGCGRIVFNGKKVGDTFVGVLPMFQGRAIELTFSK